MEPSKRIQYEWDNSGWADSSSKERGYHEEPTRSRALSRELQNDRLIVKNTNRKSEMNAPTTSTSLPHHGRYSQYLTLTANPQQDAEQHSYNSQGHVTFLADKQTYFAPGRGGFTISNLLNLPPTAAPRLSVLRIHDLRPCNILLPVDRFWELVKAKFGYRDLDFCIADITAGSYFLWEIGFIFILNAETVNDIASWFDQSSQELLQSLPKLKGICDYFVHRMNKNIGSKMCFRFGNDETLRLLASIEELGVYIVLEQVGLDVISNFLD